MPYAKASSPQHLPENVLRCVKQLRANNLTLVLATGVFDVLHKEHRAFLEKAKAAGDVLIVGIESDVRVRKLKGEGRPYFDELVRLQNIEQLQIADEAFILPEQFDRPEDYVGLIRTLKPTILAVSSHSPHIDRKQAVMELVGGRVEVVHQHNPGVSTTILLEKE
jgi:cytidyltransferase-like protein